MHKNLPFSNPYTQITRPAFWKSAYSWKGGFFLNLKFLIFMEAKMRFTIMIEAWVAILLHNSVKVW